MGYIIACFIYSILRTQVPSMFKGLLQTASTAWIYDVRAYGVVVSMFDFHRSDRG